MNIEPFIEKRIVSILAGLGLTEYVQIRTPFSTDEMVPNNLFVEATLGSEYVYGSKVFEVGIEITLRLNPDTLPQHGSVSIRNHVLGTLVALTAQALTGDNVIVYKWKLTSGSRSKDGDVDVSTFNFETLACLMSQASAAS